MNEPVLTAEQMLAWNERTSSDWRTLIATHPEILSMPCDVAGVSTAGELLQHIVAVELRYAERLAGLPATDYANISFETSDALHIVHERATALLRKQLDAAVDWNERIEFATRSMGMVRSTRKTVFFHALLHGMRHYAQLATLIRQQGVKAGFPMDYLPMDMEPV